MYPITELTEENLRAMYFAQIAMMRDLCGNIIDHDWYTDSAHDEMTGCLDLLQAFYNMQEDHGRVTVDLLQRVIAATCCDSVAPLVIDMLFGSHDAYDEFTEDSPMLTSDYDPYRELSDAL